MARRDGCAIELAGAILDGSPIDWAAAISKAAGHERRLIDQLRLVADVAAVHRHDRPLPPADASATAAAGDAAVHAPARWGHLRVLEPIGRGAFGEVYRAWDTRLDREVALKLLPVSPSSGEARASSIIEEGRLLARVRHQNVVTIYGADRIDSHMGLWMELVDGQTLEERLRQRGPFAPGEVVRVGVELGRAVAAVHAAGLLHRDIKAQNVILAAGGRVVLMDFGTGLEAQNESQPGLVGTPLYLAPELLAGQAATVRSDIYSLGVLLFHLATGSYPVQGETIDELRRTHARRGAERPGAARSPVPLRLARVIDRAIDPASGRRYRDAAALADALEALTPRPRLVPALATALAVVAGVLGALEIDSRHDARTASGGGAPWMRWGSPAMEAATDVLPRSVAVLPFEPASPADADEALQFGMAEAVIHQLSRIRPLEVAPFARVRPYGAEGRDPLQAGATLGVDAVLEGHFEKAGGRVQVRWRLLRTRGGAVLAADTWDRPADDILQVQGRLAASIVRALEITLTPEERERVSQNDTDSPEAFLHYLFGRHHLEARSVLRAIEAEREFREALALDPSYARAHAALSLNLTHQAWLGGRPGIDVMGPARDAALRAVSLDDSVALAHTSLAVVYELFDHDPARAEAAHLRAMACDDEDLWVLREYSSFLLRRGASDEALELNRRALDLDPTSPLTNRFRAQMFYTARRYDECVEQSRRTLALDPQDLSLTLNWLPLCLEQQGRRREAVEAREQGRALRGDAEGADRMKRVYAEHGWTAYWQNQLQLAAGRDLPSARAHVRLGDLDEAIRRLERLYEARHPWLAFTNQPEWDPLRGDARFQALRARAGFADTLNAELGRARARATARTETQ